MINHHYPGSMDKAAFYWSKLSPPPLLPLTVPIVTSVPLITRIAYRTGTALKKHNAALST